MDWNGQLVVALALVAFALVLVFRRLWHLVRHGEPAPCSLPIRCGGCPLAERTGLMPQDGRPGRNGCSLPGEALSEHEVNGEREALPDGTSSNGPGQGGSSVGREGHVPDERGGSVQLAVFRTADGSR